MTTAAFFPASQDWWRLVRSGLVALIAGLGLSSELWAQAERGQPEYVSQSWTTEHGLPHNRIFQIVSDEAGFVWVATQSGLTRFDGRAFKDFSLPRSSQKHGPAIRAIAQESPSVLLLIPSGDEVLRLEKGVFSVHPVSAHLAGQVPTDIFVEPGGALWVGTTDGTLHRWEAGVLRTFGKADGIDRRAPVFSFAIDSQKRTWVASGVFLGHFENGRLVRFPEPQGRVVTIAPARSGDVWVLAAGKLKKLEKDTLTTLIDNPPWEPLRASVRNFFEDREGRLWIAATRQGIFWFQDGRLTQAPLARTTYTDIIEDRAGHLLLGADDDGLTMLRRKRFQTFDTAVGLPNKISLSVCADRDGDMWFANRRGGLFRWRAGRLERFWDNESTRVFPDSMGNLWVTTADRLFRFSPDLQTPPEMINQPVHSITLLFVTGQGDVWIGGVDQTPGILRGRDFFPVTLPDHGTITAIAEDKSGRVWVGSDSGGLFQFKEGRLQPALRKDALSAARIHCLFTDRAGALWIGTADGLFLFDQERLHRFAEPEGLRDHIILQIAEDDLGEIWLGSRRGYSHIAREELLACAAGRLPRVNELAFGREEGLGGVLPLTETQPASWKDRQGHLWFTTQEGVITFDPAALSPPARQPTVVIDDMRIDGTEVATGTRQIRIPPGRHRLEMQLVAPVSTPANLRFRYQMEGFDAGWIETSPGQPVSYSNLAPGRYRLHVTARDGSGRWSDQGAELAVIVVPAWWQRVWVRLGASLFMLAGVSWSIRYAFQLKLRRHLDRVEKERALDRERTRIARDIHDELGSGVTGVRFLVSRLKEGPPANAFGRVLDQLTRQTQQLAFDLERVVWAVHPKNNSLDQLAHFIGRFARNLLQDSPVQCSVSHATDIPPLPMAPEIQHHILAVAKETLTNVLKHSGATEIFVETSYRDDVFTLTIRDNGHGFQPAAPEHSERNGLSNMRSRAEETGGQLTIESSPTAGTVVCLSIPVKAARPLSPTLAHGP